MPQAGLSSRPRRIEARLVASSSRRAEGCSRRDRAHQVLAFGVEQVMLLRRREAWRAAASARSCRARATGCAALRSAIGVVADPGADPPGARAAVAEEQRDDPFAAAREAPTPAPRWRGRRFRRRRCRRSRPASRAASARADRDDILPGRLEQRLGQLLKPAVVGEAAVVDRRVGPEDDLDLRLRRARQSRGCGCVGAAGCSGRRHRRRTRSSAPRSRPSIVARAAPPRSAARARARGGRVGRQRGEDARAASGCRTSAGRPAG